MAPKTDGCPNVPPDPVETGAAKRLPVDDAVVNELANMLPVVVVELVLGPLPSVNGEPNRLPLDVAKADVLLLDVAVHVLAAVVEVIPPKMLPLEVPSALPKILLDDVVIPPKILPADDIVVLVELLIVAATVVVIVVAAAVEVPKIFLEAADISPNKLPDVLDPPNRLPVDDVGSEKCFEVMGVPFPNKLDESDSWFFSGISLPVADVDTMGMGVNILGASCFSSLL